MQSPLTMLDYRAITDRQRQAWSTGNFHQLARQLVTISEDVVRSADPRPGERVLDVACGSGNTALVAARRYCEVTGIDFVPGLIEQARRRAATDGVEADFIVGDAQDLPFPDASFDVVLSVMGVMFAPDQERAAAELLRVCKPGGRIGIAAWPSDGSIADFFRAHADYGDPPPDGLRPPFRWGTREGLQELIGPGARSLHTERRTTTMYYRSPEHAVEVLRTYFGPTMLALAELDEANQRNLQADLVALHRANNKATDGTLSDEAEYVLAIAERASRPANGAP
jgi:ubiquinone/menaquinone biosynthesis C-methylase UbiE